MEEKKAEIIVIGAGAAGLVVAKGASKAGKKVILIDRGTWGGDCTNFGCIPSKTLIESSKEIFPLISHCPEKVNTSEILEKVRKKVTEIRREEDPKALEKDGVITIEGTASFYDSHHVVVENSYIVQGDNIVIACGSYPFIPPIEGLKDTPYLTNETIFDLKKVPKKLLILGGGPIGCELSQAFKHLGARVVIIEHSPRLFTRGDVQASEVIQRQFTKDGIEVLLNTKTGKVEYNGSEFCLSLSENQKVTGSHLLVAVGRRPSIEKLQLENAGINYTERGIVTDAYGRCSQKHIWAVGDVSGGALFTHMAEYEGRGVLRNLLLPKFLKQKIKNTQEVPYVIYTSPEIAGVGLTEDQAEKRYGKKRIVTYFVPFDQVDRARVAEKTNGFLKVVTKKWSSKILGATIVGPRAGEMSLEILLAIKEKIPLRKLANLIHPYPTYSRAIRKAADQWLLKTILTLFR